MSHERQQHAGWYQRGTIIASSSTARSSPRERTRTSSPRKRPLCDSPSVGPLAARAATLKRRRVTHDAESDDSGGDGDGDDDDENETTTLDEDSSDAPDTDGKGSDDDDDDSTTETVVHDAAPVAAPARTNALITDLEAQEERLARLCAVTGALWRQTRIALDDLRDTLRRVRRADARRAAAR